MRLTRGQAARQGAAEAARRAGRLMHNLVQIALALFLVSLVAMAVLAVRLAQGPLPAAWVARQIAVAASTPDRLLHIGGANLTWEGLHGGIDRPLDLVLHDVTLIDKAAGTQVSVPRAEVSLSLVDALLGRIVPRAVVLDGLRVSLDTRAATAGEANAISSAGWHDRLTELLQALRTPPSHAGDLPALARQLRRVRLTDVSVALRDDALGLHGEISSIDVDLLRAASGGTNFHLSATLKLGGQNVALRSSGELQAQSGDLVLALATDRFMPALFAVGSPLLDQLSMVQLPLTLSGTARLDSHLALRRAALDAVAEHGTLLLGDGALPIRNGLLRASLTPDQLTLQLRQLVLQATGSSPPSHISGQIDAHLLAEATQQQLAADVSLDIDQVPIDDMPALWPLGMGGPGTRPWLVANVHGGVIRNGHVGLSLTAPLDFSDATVTKLTGGADGSDTSVTWLTPVPPIEHASGHLVFVDPDTLDIFITGGRQSGTQLTTRQGKLRMTGLAAHDQFLALELDVGGPLADVFQLLHHKRIGLLDRLKFPLRDPSGQATGKLSVSLPLKTDLNLDDVAIHATGQVTDGHIGGIAGGHDMDHAEMTYDVSNAGLNLSGDADISGVPAQIAAMMDFRPGGPAEVTEKVDATATLSGDQLTVLGANPDHALSGTSVAHLIYQERRGGQDELSVTADVAGTAIADPLLAWTKKAGSAGEIEMHARMHEQKIAAIDRLRADAPGLRLRASVETEAGEPSVVHIDTLKLGETTDLSGTLHLPHTKDAPLVANLSGAAIDLSGVLAHRDTGKNARGPIYRIDAHLDRVTMAGGQVWQNVAAQVESDGWITGHADVTATAGTGKTTLQILRGPDGRTMQLKAEDAGATLAAFDISQRVVGGTLEANGRYDDASPAHTLSGSANMENFRVRDAPAIGRLLQALSVYGLFDVANGPGLGLTRLTAPFDLTTDTLTLKDARAFSASLGFTAKGTVDLNKHVSQIEGTVIPLYFFNSLLGRLPLVGKLFSPEKEGGLLASSYSIRGKIDDPTVTVNPLSALTPGVLRGFFDFFNASPEKPTTP